MKIEIDQSGKIENTNKLTVISYSNKINKSILITSKDKKSIQSVFRKIGQPKLFVYKLFAVAIFILIKDKIKQIDQIIIDKEYVGYENLIKDFICQIAQKDKTKIDRKNIHFKSIGRKSKAHEISINSFRKKKADKRLSAKEFYNLNFK
jgi:hypothetical protein